MQLNEGDIFYIFYEGEYHIYKLLKKEPAEETFHVLSYETMKTTPSLQDLHLLQVHSYHAPVHEESFDEAIFLINTPVTDDDLIGYHEYLQQTEQDFDETLKKATEEYRLAYRLTDEEQYEAAITHYTNAIALVPTFYEAIDNRAFCKMDLGWWAEAIADFRLSLQVQPGSLLAEFSIGECYFRLGAFEDARLQFEKCLKLDPTHAVSKEFLLRSAELAKTQQ